MNYTLRVSTWLAKVLASPILEDEFKTHPAKPQEVIAMAHARPRHNAVEEARTNARAQGHNNEDVTVRIDLAAEGQGWLIAVACDHDQQPLANVKPSSQFRDIVGEV